MRAVAFDYRDTLAEFRWDDDLWHRGVRAMLDVAGIAAGETERAAGLLRRRFAERDPGDLRELDYPAAVADMLSAVGAAAPAGLVRRCIAAEYRAWAPARHVHPAALALLDGVRELGLACALAANTFDPPGLFRADLRAQGIAGRVDAIVLSCELGVRKPHPAFYRAVAAGLGAEPADVVFVGDRVRDDVLGPAAAGMRTCLAGWYRLDPGDPGDSVPICTEPLQVLGILEALVGSGSPGKI